ncbi:MAG: potassium transporter KefB, partial [Candidatus Latescibacteria bacterium]|nr:potassium transporter KefB [Candidatus Latescibacterota bacterium]
LLTGIMAGPHGFGAITATHEVEILAEIGVVLLLFTIGLEFSLKHLSALKRYALIGGGVQVFLTILVVWYLSSRLGLPEGEAIFMGLLVALSSTAIVLKVLQDRAEISAAHGQIILAILIFQDIIIVPMMMFTPFLAGTSEDVGNELVLLAFKVLGIIIVVFFSARYAVPFLLYQIARTRSRELFALAIVLICLAVAWLTSSLGLSLALGAFLAGLIVSESEYSHQALSHIMPFRDIFASFFFVSIGMLLDVEILLQKPLLILSLTVGVVVLKSAIGTAATLFSGGSLRSSILAGTALSQVGEFSFILSKSGIETGLLPDANYQLFLAVSVVTMVLSPFIIQISARIASTFERLPIPLRFKDQAANHAMRVESLPDTYLSDHLIIVGYGVNGRNVARTARIAMIPYVIVEMNPETVIAEQDRGEPIMYGDASAAAVLTAAGVERARILVAAVPDAAATRGITAEARRLSSQLHIIARTRLMLEVGPLYQLGANEVIPEEFETSIEIFTRVLFKYDISREDIESYISEIRSDGYGIFRQINALGAAETDIKFYLPDTDITAVLLEPGAPLAGQSLAETNMRALYGVTVVSINRDENTITNPDGGMKLRENDVLILMGTAEQVEKMAKKCLSPHA